MSQSTATKFFFELNAQGESTEFHEVEGVSTDITLKHLIRPGDNPFKYRLPSLPKDRKLVFHRGSCKPDSKILGWFNGNGAEEQGKERAVLNLKDDKGNILIEWVLYSAFPLEGKAEKDYSKAGLTEIDTLSVGYGFYTVALK